MALPISGMAKRASLLAAGADCSLVPSETAGPFPLDLSDNTFYFRQDIREDRVGTPLHLRMRILGTENCGPMANVRVNIWHCDNLGNYSGYGTEVGLTYLRGYQIADANGEVEFLTAFPGWYPGRVCHIHFQVFVNSNYSAVSQFTFPHSEVNTLYAVNPDEYLDGPDPLIPENDGAFNDGYELQLSTLAVTMGTDDYDAFYEVTVQGEGSVGISYQEQRTALQMELGQNAPNPFTTQTSIPFTLHKPGKVQLDLWHPSGQKVKGFALGQLPSGTHQHQVDFSSLNLAPASYIYQMTLENEEGRFTTVKRMTFVQA